MNRYIFLQRNIPHAAHIAIILFFTFIFLGFTQLAKATDQKDSMKSYIKDISSAMTDVDITMRSIGFGTFPIKEGIKRLNSYIAQLGFMPYPKRLSKQRKMVLLSFRKLRMGLLLFSAERKKLSLGLIKEGTQLLKYAAKDIISIAKEEGIIKRKKGKKEDKAQ